MELSADLTQGLEDLGGQHDDGQAMEERNIPEHEAHTDFDGHEGHRQGRQELQDTAGEESDAQSRHGCLRVRVAECTQMGPRTFLAAEGLQRR